MAAGDNFEKIRGTSSNLFQMGLLGPNIKQNAGVIEFRNAGDSAYAVVRTATPVNGNDCATKDYVDLSRDIFQAYDSAGGTNVNSATPTVIPLGTTTATSSGYSLVAGRVTVVNAGWYDIDFHVLATQSSANRVEYAVQLYRDSGGGPVAYDPSYTTGYVRGAPTGTNSTKGAVTMSTFILCSAGDILDIRASQSGTATDVTTTIANCSLLKIKRIS